MKVSGRAGDRFCANPPDEVNRILIYGPNRGLVRQRAERCARAYVGDDDDPFRVSMLDPADLKREPGRLYDAAAEPALLGGRRVLRVRGAFDGLAGAFQLCAALPPESNPVIVEAEALRPASPLRRFFEQDEHSAAVPCYEDDAEDAVSVIEEVVQRAGRRIAPDAAAWLAERAGGDRERIVGEAEKLLLFVGTADDPEITLARVAESVGDGGEASADEVAAAVAQGDLRALDRAYRRAAYAGMQPITLLRAVGRRLVRLHLVAGMREGGADEATAMGALRPPAYPSQKAALRSELSGWSAATLQSAIALVVDAERECKIGGAPPHAVCQRTLMRLCAARARAA